MDEPRSPRHRSVATFASTAVLIVVLPAALLAGCSSDGERVTITTTTAPPSTADLARQTCTDVLDERSELVSRNATEAMATLREAVEAAEAPEDDVLAHVQDALGAERGQLADAQAVLRAVEVPDDLLEDWTTVVSAADPVMLGLDETLEFLRQPDWERAADAIGHRAPTPDRVALDTALERLDLLGTDCEWVYDYPGDPVDAAPFHRDAAAACSVSVERRRQDGFQLTDATPAEQASEEAATTADLAVVDPGTLDDPAPWDRFVAAGGAGEDAAADLEVLGLDQRPCAALDR